MTYELLVDSRLSLLHLNIIRYCERPFKSAEEMNKVIIRKHNERVKPEDTVFFLGDFIFKGGKEGGEENKEIDQEAEGKVGKGVCGS